MPEPLEPALARLRPLLADPGRLVRAVGAGRRRRALPAFVRAELRPVRLKGGLRLQVTTTDGRTPTIANHAPGEDADRVVEALLAEPFGNWHVETRDEVIQLRVTKSGDAQVHRQALPVREKPLQEAPVREGPVQEGPVQEGPVQEGPVQEARVRKGPVEEAPVREAAAQGALVREATDHEGRARDATVTAHDRAKHHLLDPGEPLFAALGADADKRRQVDAFLRQLVAAAGRTVEHVREQRRPLRVVDLGCGNAYLTFAAHRYLSGLLPDGVRTLGVDVRPDLVARNARLAGELGLAGLEFAVGTIDAAHPGGPFDEGVDVVLALHACDTATDDALARAVAWGAPVVLAAPCCHHDVQRQLDDARAAGLPPPAPHAALVRHPILRERFADVLTDTFRAQLLRLAGYAVDVVEFVDSRHTPRNALIRATRRRRHSPRDPALAAEHAELAAAWHVRPALAERLAAAGHPAPEPPAPEPPAPEPPAPELPAAPADAGHAADRR